MTWDKLFGTSGSDRIALYPVGAALNISAATGVLANDTDPDTHKTLLSVQVETNVKNGTLNLQPNGAFTYTPNPGFAGTDSFSYRVNDPKGALSLTGPVVINANTVNCIPRPPVTVTKTVVDTCGTWPTFVGGGSAAGS